MEEGLVDPLSLAKDADLMKDAQLEFGKLDVLICGKCHTVFHFIEEYNTHKTNNCEESNVAKDCENEDKSITWAFCLWKSKETKDDNVSIWQMYQKWCKLPQQEKNLWITGGQTILSLNKIRIAKMQEVKFKVKREEKDPLEISENDVPNDEGSESKSSTNKQALSRPAKLGESVTVEKEQPKEELNEYVVESIQGKRFNTRKKNWEYKVKWENWDESHCSWEPIEHLSGCKALISLFEEKLRIDKERKRTNDEPIKTAKSKIKPEIKTDDESVDNGYSRRPQRSSKKRALHQVKRWLGENGSDNEDFKGNSRKRLLDDDSDENSFEKKLKLEEESDDSMDEADDDEKPRKSSVMKHNSSNGLAGKKLPNNVLIPDAQGVVRINQKQLPSLSSGVYIMSKTAGIIKLDPKTSKIAASGGQAVVKVAPRIGQTHISIVKKDGGTANRVLQMTPKSKIGGTNPRSLISHKVTKLVKNPTSRVKTESKFDDKKMINSMSEADDAKESTHDDDSDFGLPDLEFPSEIIPPEPEEPPGEFTLDPTTGKIAGVEYPEVEPETATTEDNKENSENTLDNIVKLAAADITEADLKPDIVDSLGANESSAVLAIDQSSINIEEKKPEPHRMEPMKVRKDAMPISKVQQKFVISPNIRSNTILERSLNAPRTVIKSPQGFSRQVYTKSPQRILHSAMTPKLSSPLPMVRSVMRNSYGNKPKSMYPKQQRVYMSSAGGKMNESLIKQSYHQKSNVNKRVGNIGGTTIYKKSPHQKQMMGSPKVFSRTNMVRKPSPLVRTVVQKSPRPVINMPSLMDDDVPIQPVPETLQMIQKTEVPQETQEAALTAASAGSNAEADISSFAALADGESPIFITGDDGTVYQVAGQNEQGQTILITQGPDGQQQCLLVTGSEENQEAQEGEAADSTTTTATEQSHLPIQPTENISESDAVVAAPVEPQEPLTIKTEPETNAEVVAQFVRAVPPSPGGTPQLMVMLPDGALVVTPVSAEEYASWQELEK